MQQTKTLIMMKSKEENEESATNKNADNEEAEHEKEGEKRDRKCRSNHFKHHIHEPFAMYQTA